MMDPFGRCISHVQECSLINMMNTLGTGTYGTVYLYHDETTTAAIKVVELLRGRYRLLIEPFLMANLNHPYVCQARDCYVIEDHLYMLFDVAESDLEAWSRDHEIDQDRLRMWTWQLLEALRYLHGLGIVHGDIKASNILVFSDRLKLTDFSLARLEGWDCRYRPCAYVFRPPEVWRGDKWGTKVDIWALGVTLYRLVHREIPFPFREEVDWETTSECRDTYLTLFDHWDDHKKTLGLTESNIDRIIDRCLRLDRPSAEELLRDPWFDGLRIDKAYEPLTDAELVGRLIDRGIVASLASSIIERMKRRANTVDRWDEVVNVLDSIAFSC